MKTGSRNKMPMWARFFAVLLGIPMATALLRAGFEHEFHKLTALVLTSVALIVLYLFLRWRLTSRSTTALTSKEEKKRERRRLDFALALFIAAIFLAGGVIFFVIALFPPTDLPSISRWVIRAASLFIGLLCLLIFASLIPYCRFLVTGRYKRTWTFKLRRPHSHK